MYDWSYREFLLIIFLGNIKMEPQLKSNANEIDINK